MSDKGSFRLYESERESHVTSRLNPICCSYQTLQLLKHILAFAFALTRCEWTLTIKNK